MKLTTPGLLILLHTLGASALPTASPSDVSPSDDPVRVLPYWWGFEILNLTGPGCPDLHPAPNATFITRPTYGSNTVDGSEIYYWHIAYPYIRATVVGAAEPVVNHTWCETTLQYNEYSRLENGSAQVTSDYRLKLHKNGTEELATYALDAGVDVKWKFTYFPGTGKDEVVDEITVTGPYSSGGQFDATFSSPVEKNPVRWALPQCGAGIIKYRTELTLTAKKAGAKGLVTSYEHEGQSYGTQQGFSYDFEKCGA